MPRRHRPPRPSPPPELDERILRGPRVETGPDGQWHVRGVTSQEKTYRCPGCQQLIGPGTPHTVAWPAQGWFGDDAALADRRHWHTTCWRARTRRR